MRRQEVKDDDFLRPNSFAMRAYIQDSAVL